MSEYADGEVPGLRHLVGQMLGAHRERRVETKGTAGWMRGKQLPTSFVSALAAVQALADAELNAERFIAVLNAAGWHWIMFNQLGTIYHHPKDGVFVMIGVNFPLFRVPSIADGIEMVARNAAIIHAQRPPVVLHGIPQGATLEEEPLLPGEKRSLM